MLDIKRIDWVAVEDTDSCGSNARRSRSRDLH